MMVFSSRGLGLYCLLFFTRYSHLSEFVLPQFIGEVEKEIVAKKALDPSLYEILEMSKEEMNRTCKIVSISTEKFEGYNFDKDSSCLGQDIQNIFADIGESSKEKNKAKEASKGKAKEQGKGGQRKINQKSVIPHSETLETLRRHPRQC